MFNFFKDNKILKINKFEMEKTRIFVLLQSVLKFNKTKKIKLLSLLDFNSNNDKRYQNQFLLVEKKLHKKTLEIYWTLIPAVILFIIGAPSLSVLYSISELVAPELTVKAIGNQWFWTYEYSINLKNNHKIEANLNSTMPILKDSIFINGKKKSLIDLFILVDHKTFMVKGYVNKDKILISNSIKLIKNTLKFFNGNIKYSSIKTSGKLIYESHMILEEELKVGELRLLEVDYWLILPINIEIRLLVSSVDVIHSFAVPAFGIKIDGIPGRTNEVPLFIKRKGIFYGQCSELCGVNHGFMPIVVQTMNKKSFTDILLELTGNKFIE